MNPDVLHQIIGQIFVECVGLRGKAAEAERALKEAQASNATLVNEFKSVSEELQIAENKIKELTKSPDPPVES